MDKINNLGESNGSPQGKDITEILNEMNTVFNNTKLFGEESTDRAELKYLQEICKNQAFMNYLKSQSLINNSIQNPAEKTAELLQQNDLENQTLLINLINLKVKEMKITCKSEAHLNQFNELIQLLQTTLDDIEQKQNIALLHMLTSLQKATLESNSSPTIVSIFLITLNQLANSNLPFSNKLENIQGVYPNSFLVSDMVKAYKFTERVDNGAFIDRLNDALQQLGDEEEGEKNTKHIIQQLITYFTNRKIPGF